MRHEAIIRLSGFFSVLLLMASWEIIAPKRVLIASKLTRWFNNFALVIFNTLLLRLLFPMAAVGFALWIEQQHWGLFNMIPIPEIIAVIIAVIMLDMVIYGQHVLFHHVPLLWRLHRMHHADVDIDVTTGARFHPIEILLSMGIKFAAILILGAPALAVFIFEMILNLMAMFNHANIRLNATWDKWMRLFVVTPDMHRVHHSVINRETDSNFGFNLSCWDRWFGTYQAQPALGHEKMQIGLLEFREPHYLYLHHLLQIPFLSYSSDNRDHSNHSNGK
ncbi:sterol desaturase family protein [Thioflexithrix psekupsensis]|uniref:sterol desaturase family protein n=1 Tax=Thioflexithrix psekupsensis TaxID=1570016 RepID=UPI001C3D99B6